ncbi:hypothetical protein ACRE_051280 [Hapsidospora chrysogenum ATCC 11550]|uniref:Uncharacterized protein n=1 Tax=Hapsidospora chrysogenum (strain ATCC 11550 / CBS 779.69 / DSM 880 / IAM 14645 / JCM 23072 / IMI 49137) TaxID=857340 RepID=A0A086T402_HAPC1|nr:hypothetical protein ACRE_051280 [Hapsidospora chrysogenum ATCC 11550]
MRFCVQALQRAQSLLSVSSTSSTPSDDGSRQYSAQKHHQARLPEKHKTSYEDYVVEELDRDLTPNMFMAFSQDGTLVESATNTWFGVITITATDIPRLMREGLHWTESNLYREAGCIFEPQRIGKDDTLTPRIICARYYEFQDKERKVPLWAAGMRVYFLDSEGVTSFKFRDLRLDQIAICLALNQKNQLVYGFDRNPEYHNINAIYEDMPLEGWWPWPKRSGDGEKDGKEDFLL